MGILNITTDLMGQSGLSPKFIYVDTDDLLSVVTSAGYLNGIEDIGYSINEKSMAVVSYVTPGPIVATQVSLFEITRVGSDWVLVSYPVSGLSGSGTPGVLPYFASSNSLADSLISQGLTFAKVSDVNTLRLGYVTTAERNALIAANGDMVYNTDSNTLQAYQNGVWVNMIGGGGVPPGVDQNVIFNDGGVFGADPSFNFDKTNNVLSCESISLQAFTSSFRYRFLVNDVATSDHTVSFFLNDDNRFIDLKADLNLTAFSSNVIDNTNDVDFLTDAAGGAAPSGTGGILRQNNPVIAGGHIKYSGLGSWNSPISIDTVIPSSNIVAYVDAAALVTLTLPAIDAGPDGYGEIVIVKNASTSTDVIRINAAGTDRVQDAAGWDLIGSEATLTLMADNSSAPLQWIIL